MSALRAASMHKVAISNVLTFDVWFEWVSVFPRTDHGAQLFHKRIACKQYFICACKLQNKSLQLSCSITCDVICYRLSCGVRLSFTAGRPDALPWHGADRSPPRPGLWAGGSEHGLQLHHYTGTGADTQTQHCFICATGQTIAGFCVFLGGNNLHCWNNPCALFV